MHGKAIDALDDRLKLGISRYGQPLQPANGRDAARDAWEEALDGAAYGAQVVWEQENPEHTYVGAIIEALELAQNGVIDPVCDFGNMFVPQGVLDLLATRGINYHVMDSE